MRTIRFAIITLTVCLSFGVFSLPALAGGGVLGFDSHIDRIDKMQKTGKISRDEAVYRKLQGLFEPEKLPGQYMGAPVKSATFALLDLQMEAKKIKDKRIKKLVDSYFVTLDETFQKGLGSADSVSSASDMGFNLSNLTDYYPRSGSNFKIWYTKTGEDAVPSEDVNKNNIPDFVESVSIHLNTSWAKLVPVFGEPPGPSTRYNVYLKDLRSRGLLYGLSAAKGISNSYSWPSFIIMENDFATFPGNIEDNIKTTASHEFFHAIHYGYNPFHTDRTKENRWFAEASAVWAESVVFPELKTYIDLLYRSSSQRLGWMANPEASLTTWDGDDSNRKRQYGSSVFIKFLDEQKGGVTRIKNVWARLRNLDLSLPGTVIGAIDKELRLAKKGTFNGFFALFASKNFNVAAYKDSQLIKAKKNTSSPWSSYPYHVEVVNISPYSSYPVTKIMNTSDKPLPEYLGTNYHVFNAVSAGKTFFFRGEKDLTGKKTGKWIVNLLLRKKGTSTYTVKRLMNPSSTENFLVEKDFNNITYDRAVMVASVVGPAGNGRYTYRLSAKHISTASLSSNRTTVPVGGTVTFYGRLSPKHENMGNVFLQKSLSGTGAWTNVAKMTWSSTIGKYKLAYKPSKTLYYRLYWRGDFNHGPSRSAKIKVYIQ